LSGEQSLWDGIRNSHVNSLEALYLKYNEELYSYGKKFTSDEHLVEDAVQETFIALWKYRQSLTVTTGFNYYLLKSFRNLLFRLIKERANTTYSEEQPDFHLEIGFDHQLIASEDQTLLSQKIQEALSQLTSRQREIIYFRFFENRSFEEIADIMNMQVRATYKLTARALAALKDIMEGTSTLLLLTLLRNF
jgi:RNA polymerase sigma factor (sigma-70 family)